MLAGLNHLDRPGATLVAIGAHADDIEIGAGATLLQLRDRCPDLHLRWVVCCAEGDRRSEAEAAARAFGADDVAVGVLPDRFLPEHWGQVKRWLAGAVADVPRDAVVLAPWRLDRHQDHRVVGELVWQLLRSHPVLAYEIAKYDGGLGQPNLYVPATADVVARKVDLLTSSFPSQADKPWFGRGVFEGLMAVRGVEAATAFAEGFIAEKLIWVP